MSEGRMQNAGYWGKVLRIAVIPIVIICTGGAVLVGSLKMRKAPERKEYREPVRDVETMTVQLSDEQITLSGYGSVRSNRVIPVSMEVSGKVRFVHKNLEDGTMVRKGEVLVKVDVRDYSAAHRLQKAECDRISAEIELLKAELLNNKELLELRSSSLELSKREFERLRNLAQKKIGSDLAVEGAESRVLAGKERLIMIRHEISRLPIRVKSMEAMLEQAKSRLAQAQLNLERCVYRAPFAGRINGVQVEVGQVITPSLILFSLVDDEAREIRVALNAAEASRWLPFDQSQASRGWLPGLQNVPVKVRWLEAESGEFVTGRILRVAGVDEQARTIDAVIGLDNGGGRAVVSGMFCSVEIPGRTAKQVFRIPRVALTKEGKVAVMTASRLKSKSVEMVRFQGKDAFVRGSVNKGDSDRLSPGDALIVSPLLSPIDGQQLRDRKTMIKK